MFVYLQNKQIYDKYKKAIERGGVTRTVTVPMIGKVDVWHELDSGKVDMLKNEPIFKLITDINTKLEPLVDIIKSSMEDEYDAIEKMILKNHG